MANQPGDADGNGSRCKLSFGIARILDIDNDSASELNKQVSSGSNSLMGSMPNSSIIESQQEKRDDIEKRICVPYFGKRRTSTGRICCKGCGKEFLKYYNVAEPDYRIHCISQCSKYQELNLIRTCNGCNKIFTNYKAMNGHHCSRKKKPRRKTTVDVSKHV